MGGKLKVSDASVGNKKERAGEMYDSATSRFREEVNRNNHYNVILCHNPQEGWYHKFQNEYIHGPEKDKCKKCEFFLSISIAFGLMKLTQAAKNFFISIFST